MMYVWHSICKSLSQQSLSKFMRFDFLKNLYALNYGMKGVYGYFPLVKLILTIFWIQLVEWFLVLWLLRLGSIQIL